MSSVAPIPPGFHSITPHLVVRNCMAAIEFYKRAFGAQELVCLKSPDGKVMHAEVKIGDSIVMLGDEVPMMDRMGSPQKFNGTTVSIHIYCDDADAMFARAVKAGAKAVMPVGDMFWGDRYGKVSDPFGHEWAIATHTRDLTQTEIEDAVAALFADPPAEK